MAISFQPIETPKLWKGLSCYFNPPINYQVLAPLQGEDVVTTTQATVEGIEKVLQTSSEGTRQITHSSSPNTKDEKQVHIENNLNLRTPSPIVLTFGTLEWISKDG